MRTFCATVALAVLPASFALAQSDEIAEGRKLYEKECLVCHGENTAGKTSQRPHALLAHASTFSQTMLDVPADGWLQLAVAPPFGPNLRGIIGRPAGSVEGFNYSAPFIKSLRGMVWDEGSLDVWITSTQKWVPGVTMYYSQKNPDIRRKIIQYLKAN